MKRLLCMLAACALAVSLSGCGDTRPAKTDLFAMDTYMTLVAYGDGAQDALAEASRTINALEQRLSRTREGSDVWQINHGGGRVDPMTAHLIQQAMDYSLETGGAFDMTVAPLVDLWAINSDSPHVPSQEEIDALLPLVGAGHVAFDVSQASLSGPDTVSLDEGCAIDLGGIAKGYAGNAVAAVFAEHGVTSGTASLGGNVYVCGTRPDGKPWSVAVQDPLRDGYACLLQLQDTFAVTSGGYQRYFTAPDGAVYQHILDPKTGRPAESDLLSVTVVCPDGTRSDAYSTALYVMGEAGAVAFWGAHQGDDAFDMVLITADGRLLYTPGLAGNLSEQEGSSYVFQPISR